MTASTMANDTEYGLVAYAFTENLTRASLSRKSWRPGWSASTRASCPTPPRRSAASRPSGLGREGGTEGIEEYLETKYVGIKL